MSNDVTRLKTDIRRFHQALNRRKGDEQRLQQAKASLAAAKAQTPANLGEVSSFERAVAKDKKQVGRDNKQVSQRYHKALKDLVPAEYEMNLTQTNQARAMLGLKPLLHRLVNRKDVDPLGPAWTLGRTDQGVDATAPVGTPIRAINKSKVVRIVPNWYAGQPLVLMKLEAGPNKGKYWYVSEQIDHLPKVGEVIKRGGVVARYAPSGTAIEIGWGSTQGPGYTLAQQKGELRNDPTHADTAAGINFRNRILALRS